MRGHTCAVCIISQIYMKKNASSHQKEVHNQEEQLILAQGVTLTIISSDTTRSTGTLTLVPSAVFPRTHLPHSVHLSQINGESVLTVFDEEAGPLVHHLTHGSTFTLLPEQDFQQVNQSGHDSVTAWHVDGDLSDTIASWRHTARMRDAHNAS